MMAIRGLPLVEIPVHDQPASTLDECHMAVLLTGDGGWAALDRGLAEAFKKQGIATIALNSLRYFWKLRTPEQLAHDLERVLAHYLHAWRRSRAILVGYSFGADVLPFALNRLPATSRARIATVNLLGLSATAAFEIRFMDWLRGQAPGLPVAPQLRTLTDMHILCLSGRGDDSGLSALHAEHHIKTQRIGQGHHFSGQYAVLAQRILGFVEETSRPR